MVRIITDSAADFEPAELKEKQIICIPLTVAFGQQEYHENENLSKDRFYDLLTTSESFPKTSQASPQILMDLFKDADKHGDEAIYINLLYFQCGIWIIILSNINAIWFMSRPDGIFTYRGVPAMRR